MIRAAVREPLVHFLLLGSAIYALYAVAGPEFENAGADRIVVTEGEIEWLTATWQKRWNRAPTPAERNGLIQNHIRETVLYREALAMGLDRDDTIVRRRLAQKLEFLSQDLVATVPTTDEELRSYFARQGDLYEIPALTTLTHVFIDPDRRRGETAAHAERIGAELRALDPPTAGALEKSDPFMLQSYYAERRDVELAKLFGSEFARTVAGLAAGEWQGPVRSSYGLHWVYVEQRSVATTPEFEAVRERVDRDFRDDRRGKFNEEFYASLRARYEILIEGEGEGEGSQESSSADYAAAQREAP